VIRPNNLRLAHRSSLTRYKIARTRFALTLHLSGFDLILAAYQPEFVAESDRGVGRRIVAEFARGHPKRVKSRSCAAIFVGLIGDLIGIERWIFDSAP
jgi:hypothetical protein